MLIVSLGLLLAGASGAAEPDNHEDLGRVFMTPAERHELDRLRRLQPAASSAASVSTPAAPAAPAESDVRPMGIIVPSRGRPYQWRDGDFRPVDAARIRIDTTAEDAVIKRHTAPRHSPKDEDGSAGERERGAADQE